MWRIILLSINLYSQANIFSRFSHSRQKHSGIPASFCYC